MADLGDTFRGLRRIVTPVPLLSSPSQSLAAAATTTTINTNKTMKTTTTTGKSTTRTVSPPVKLEVSHGYALHASSLCLTHPVTLKRMIFFDPDPPAIWSKWFGFDCTKLMNKDESGQHWRVIENESVSDDVKVGRTIDE